MSVIKSEVKSKKLFLFVTALDQTLIAKPNFELTENCWESLPKFNMASGVYMQNLSETFAYDHLSELISDSKYSFLRKNTDEFYLLLNELGSIRLPVVFWQELNILRRFGYYYRHTLAITSLVAKFGFDMKMAKDDLDIYLQAAIIHDIGISRLPHSILFSSQQFKEDEEILMHQHPLASYLLFGYYNQKENDLIGNGILYHHCPNELNNTLENNNQVKANDISWMLFNMDVFDALINSRPFRPAFSIDNALAHLAKLNQTLSMPLDIVHWLEKRLKTSSNLKLNWNLVPIKPAIEADQLN